MARYLVVGLGNFGSGVATSLHEMGHEVAGLDMDPDKVERMSNLLPSVAAGDATDPEVLERMGTRGIDSAVVSVGNDVTSSVLVCLALRDLGVRRIHVKVVSELHGRMAQRVGVEDTIFPERESAHLLARRIGSRSIVRYVELGPGFSAQEMAVPDRWVGKSLRELELPRRFRIGVVAVRDYLSGDTAPIPDPDAPLKASDTLLVAGRDADLERVARIG